ncbi:protein of unknown function [Paraburkholderia kururiensis]
MLYGVRVRLFAILESINRRECIVMMGQRSGGQKPLFYALRSAKNCHGRFSSSLCPF